MPDAARSASPFGGGSGAGRALSGDPAGIQAELSTATERARRGDWPAALHGFRRVLSARPGHPQALAGLVDAATRIGDLPLAANALEKAVAVNAPIPDARLKLAALLGHLGRLEDAVNAARAARAEAPDDARAWAVEATACERLNRLEDAEAAATRALELDPHSADATMTLAVVERRRGRLEAARDRLEALLARETDANVQVPAFRELGLVRDRLGEHALAFEAFRRSGSIEARLPQARRIDREARYRRIESYDRVVTPESLRRWDREAIRDGLPAPTMLLGFPRSGTTLLEQVLGAHPGIAISGERPLQRSMRRRLVEGLDDADLGVAFERLDLKEVGWLRSLYWEAVRSVLGEDEVRDRVVLDKMPLNLLDAGLLSSIFPDARFVVAYRDPRDVCLSCLMQRFQLNPGMVHFLELETTVRFYVAVMEHWLRVKPMLEVPILEVRYEDVVADLEGQARRAIEFLGLPWDDAVLSYRDRVADQEISTPSFAAVSEPISDRAVRRWEHYREALEPHLETLQPVVEALGYA